MRKFILAILAIVGVVSASATAPAGEWSGSLSVGRGLTLKIVIHIPANDSAPITLDSPDQGAYGIEGETVYLSADSINFRIPRMMMSYEGRIAGDRIDGTLRQGPAQIPLSLTPGAAKANRPQTPQPPFPYSTEELAIANQDGGATLAGTLTVPAEADGNTPLVVLVSGSGLQNRDEELFEHKPFAIIADMLARNGIATFRYDDRDIGGSTGDVVSATTADFASDAAAVTKYLRESGRFGQVGLLGHSEGGLIGYMLGATGDAPDFIISVAGPSIKGSSTIAYQNMIAAKSTGISDSDAESFGRAAQKVIDFRLDNPGVTIPEESYSEFYPEMADNQITRALANSLFAAPVAESSNPWMSFFLRYDPANDLSGVKVPMLIIYGEKDTQVPPSLNAPRARELAPTATVAVYPSLNHLMQHATTGNVDEYSVIEETISPEVLTDIARFIHSCASHQ